MYLSQCTDKNSQNEREKHSFVQLQQFIMRDMFLVGLLQYAACHLWKCKQTGQYAYKTIAVEPQPQGTV